MPQLDASWIPLVGLLVGGLTAGMILRIFAAVYSQAEAHYDLAVSARRLRATHIARMKEIEQALQREAKARAAINAQRAALGAAPIDGGDDEVVGVDIVEAA